MDLSHKYLGCRAKKQLYITQCTFNVRKISVKNFLKARTKQVSHFSVLFFRPEFGPFIQIFGPSHHRPGPAGATAQHSDVLLAQFLYLTPVLTNMNEISSLQALFPAPAAPHRPASHRDFRGGRKGESAKHGLKTFIRKLLRRNCH